MLVGDDLASLIGTFKQQCQLQLQNYNWVIITAAVCHQLFLTHIIEVIVLDRVAIEATILNAIIALIIVLTPSYPVQLINIES